MGACADPQALLLASYLVTKGRMLGPGIIIAKANDRQVLGRSK